MTGVFTIEGRFPSLGDYVAAERRGRLAGASMRRREAERARLAAAAAGVPAFSGRVTVRLLWVEPSRRRDPDEIAFAKKFVLDGMVAAGVIEGDGQSRVVGLQDTFAVDPARPRVVVEVRDA